MINCLRQFKVYFLAPTFFSPTQRSNPNSHFRGKRSVPLLDRNTCRGLSCPVCRDSGSPELPGSGDSPSVGVAAGSGVGGGNLKAAREKLETSPSLPATTLEEHRQVKQGVPLVLLSPGGPSAHFLSSSKQLCVLRPPSSDAPWAGFQELPLLLHLMLSPLPPQPRSGS